MGATIRVTGRSLGCSGRRSKLGPQRRFLGAQEAQANGLSFYASSWIELLALPSTYSADGAYTELYTESGLTLPQFHDDASHGLESLLTLSI